MCIVLDKSPFWLLSVGNNISIKRDPYLPQTCEKQKYPWVVKKKTSSKSEHILFIDR